MTITVAAAVVYGSRPTVQISVASSPTVADSLVLFRVHDDGTQHRVLLESGAVLVGSYVGNDYHAPFNQRVTYVAQSGGLTSAESGPVWVPGRRLWLVHAGVPALSVLVDKWMAVAAYEYGSTSKSYQVLGRKLPVVRSDYPRNGESGTLTVKCDGRSSRAAMKALLADDGPILVNTQFTDDEVGWKWVQVGKLTFQNPAGFNSFPYRAAVLPYVECAQPDTDQGFRTFDQGEADFPGATLASMGSVYATLQDAKLDKRL